MASPMDTKVQIGNTGTFHRFAHNGDFAGVLAKLETIAASVSQWAERLGNGLLVTYKDDEGDQVRLMSDPDLATATAFGTPLRLTIRPAGGAGMHRHHCGGGGGGGGGGWHRWATEKYGQGPARRLAAAAKLDHKAAVGKLAAAMHGDDTAANFVEEAMKTTAAAPHRMGCGRHRHCAGAHVDSTKDAALKKIFGIRIDPAEMKAKFGEKAAAALGVPQEEVWKILEAAKKGDEGARAQVGQAMKTACTKHFERVTVEAAAAAAAGEPEIETEACGKTCPEGHPLAAAAIATNWCDECRAVGTAFRCTEGCDHDLCAGCAAKPAAAVQPSTEPPAEFEMVDAPPAFPSHWGPAPPGRAWASEAQTKDICPLPGTFGMGSACLAEWIQLHLDIDSTAADAAEAEAARALAEAAAAGTAKALAEEAAAEVAARKEVGVTVRPEWQGGLQQMVGLMGFEPVASVAALNQHNGDVREAVSQLINA